MTTTRELQIAQLISAGYIEKEIATKLNIAYGTVHTLKARLMDKWKIHNSADITRIYLLKYDSNFKRRIEHAFRHGRRQGLTQSRTDQTADFPTASLCNLWKAANHSIPSSRRAEPCKDQWTDFLQLIRIANGDKIPTDMNELKKIDQLQWLYANMTTEQLSELLEIAKDLKDYEDKNSKRTGHTHQRVPGTGRQD